MKIYTKTGDTGMTSLLSGRRVAKTDTCIEAYGSVDELNAYVGLLKDLPVNQQRISVLENIQGCLFTIGAILAMDKNNNGIKVPHLQAADVDLLESEIDALQDQLPPMRSFILPGGHSVVSFGHIARTVCRRAERAVLKIGDHLKKQPYIVQYLNRLSDYLFVLCRKMAQEVQAKETPWNAKE